MLNSVFGGHRKAPRAGYTPGKGGIAAIMDGVKIPMTGGLIITLDKSHIVWGC